MKLYQLLWRLFVLGLRGRFRQDVFVAVSLETPVRDLAMTGAITGFDLADGTFIVIDAESEDPEPWCEEPPFIYDLVEASSLGTPEAKALRDSVPDEVVDRIMARYREIADTP